MYRILVLHQTLVVSAQADQKQYTRHILEAMNPFSSLRFLASNIDH